jgi:hypothetical protein
MIDKGMDNKHAHEWRTEYNVKVTVYPELGGVYRDTATIKTRSNKQDAFEKAARSWIARNGHKWEWSYDNVAFELDDLYFSYWCIELYDWWLDGTLCQKFEEIMKKHPFKFSV